MGHGLDQGELRRRAIVGVRDEVEAFGSAAPSSSLIRREGLLLDAAPRAVAIEPRAAAGKAGAPAYERLGFADLGYIEMWERRR